jgi:hypothetical protein
MKVLYGCLTKLNKEIKLTDRANAQKISIEINIT